MEQMGKVIRIDVSEEGNKELADDTRKKTKKDALEALEKSDKFILYYVTKEGGEECSESNIVSSLEGSDLPYAIRTLSKICRIMIKEVVKIGNTLTMMKLFSILKEEKLEK